MSKSESNACVTIDLDGDKPSGELAWFQPAMLISGIVEIIPRENMECRAILIQLKWFTCGRGEMDEEIVSEKKFHPAGLIAEMSMRESFSFMLPAKPWSFHGHYIDLVWAIAVKIELPFRTDVETIQVFVMSPEEEAVQIVSG